MKTATVTVRTIEISCPHCWLEVTDPSSSLWLTEDEYDHLPKTITCRDCGEKFHKPSWPRKPAA